jgi:hypothetical protein
MGRVVKTYLYLFLQVLGLDLSEEVLVVGGSLYEHEGPFRLEGHIFKFYHFDGLIEDLCAD